MPTADNVRIAEVVATLSYAADLGLGQPTAHCTRQTVIALRMGALAGANDQEMEAPSARSQEAVDLIAGSFGPLMMLRGRLEAQGVWGEVREKLEALFDRRCPGEYLVVRGRKG